MKVRSFLSFILWCLNGRVHDNSFFNATTGEGIGSAVCSVRFGVGLGVLLFPAFFSGLIQFLPCPFPTFTEEPSTLDTQAIAFYSLLAVALVLVVVVIGILGKRVRDNGGVKAVVKKIRVRSTWQVPGGATPEPVSSPLTRGQSLTSDG